MMNDRIGKVFMMFVHGTSRCLICDQLFTCNAARAHSEVSCKPAVPDSWLLTNSSARILPLSTTA
jgi:hypothetical protein